MISNQTALLNTKTTASNFHADQHVASKAFYDRVKSNFLRQSASYLRDSLSRTRSVSMACNKYPVQLKIQQG